MNPHMTICDVCNQRSYTPNEVHFCPLHEWAHELLIACQAALPAIHWGVLPDWCDIPQWAVIELQLATAIARATNRQAR